MLFRSRRTIVFASAMLLAGCQSGDTPVSWSEYAKQGAYSAAISSSGRYVSLGSMQHGGSLWDSARNARLFSWNHQAGQYSIIAATAFSPEENHAVTASQQDLVLWETGSGKALEFLSSPAEILDIDLASNGDFALLGLGDHTAVYFDLKNGGAKKTFRHDARVRAVALSVDGKYALTGSDGYKAKLWDMLTGELLQEQTFENTVDTVALSRDGRLAFSSATLNRAIVWDTATGKVLSTLTSDRNFFPQRISYLSARFSSDSRYLLTGSASGVVQLWDARKGKELRSWRLHKRDPYGPTHASVYDVGFGSGKYYAVGSNGIVNVLR